MGSLIEELEQREAAARAHVEELRGQIDELTGQLQAAQERLSRLQVTRETVEEVLAETGPEATQRANGDDGPVAENDPWSSAPGTGSVIGVQTVPPWREGLEASDLPRSYQDLLEVLADAGTPLRAKEIAVGIGLGAEKLSKIEGVRSKLKRLVRRGWLTEDVPGVFALPPTGTDAS